MDWEGGGSIEGCNLNRAVLTVDEKQYRTSGEILLYIMKLCMNDRKRGILYEKNGTYVIGSHGFTVL